MFGRPGVAYVSFMDGNHHCMNVVAHLPGVAGAVLLRGAEPLGGVGAGEARADDSRGLAGPGRLARWVRLPIAHTGWDLVRPQLHLREGAPVASRDVVRSARRGITPSLTP